MATKIEIELSNGQQDVFKANLFKVYHLHHGSDGVCVTEKKLFQKEKLVRCYPTSSVRQTAEERCPFCEGLNPTQKK
jgi:hypothetical protein